MSSVRSLGVPSFLQPVVVKMLSGPHFSHESCNALCNMLKELFENITVQKIEEKSLNFDELGSREIKILLVLPGAVDLSQLSFSKEQQIKIKTLCESGLIKVLAVCGGAFYVSKTVIYKDRENLQDRVLTLFPGKSIGPAFQREWEISSEVITLEKQDEEAAGNVAFIGGGSFHPGDEMEKGKDYKVLARYQDLPENPIAAIACGGVSGKYHAVLIGPHFEFKAQHFIELKGMWPEKEEELKEIVDRLKESSSFRLKSLFYFLSVLGFQ